MKRIALILSLLLSFSAWGFRHTSVDTVFVFPEVRLEVPEMVEFIEDVVVPLLPGLEYSSVEDHIYLEIEKREDGGYILDLTVYNDLAYIGDELGKNGNKTYINQVGQIPLLIISPPNCELLRLTGKYIRLRKQHMNNVVGWVMINDDEVFWKFIYSDGILKFDRMGHFCNDWLLARPYQEWLPRNYRFRALQPYQVQDTIDHPVPEMAAPDSIRIPPELFGDVRKRRKRRF
ncbi:MAG: hypothetical protein K2L16_07375 [Muribaculaceae bacterium]|nr:hypothetical protein [Muribaculaceae bacterium]